MPNRHKRRTSARVCQPHYILDPAIKQVELTSILSFPREGGDPIFLQFRYEPWIPAFAGKGRASTYSIAGSITP